MPTQSAAAASRSRLKFDGDSTFHQVLRGRVEKLLTAAGKRQRDCPRMYAKTAIILVAFAALYTLLVFFAATWWQAVPLAILLGLAAAEIGFNIQHDGSHKAYSKHAWINKLMAMTLDAIGGSSYIWHWKHVVFHHMYVNVKDHDADIDIGVFGRLSPHQRRRAFHRLQHWYLWPLYGVIAVKWHFFDDFRDLAVGRIGTNPFPRPRNQELVLFFAGKAAFFTLAFVIPVLTHPFWVVAAFYGIAALVLGIALSVVFQLAHCVERAKFSLPNRASGHIESAWAVHQVESTLDFSRDSKVVGWLLGGLNFQIEHHLFPRICHVHYRAISQLTETTCREFNVPYTRNTGLRTGIASHYRWLRRMGLAPEPT